jgi:hypothetical protein
MGPAVDPEGRMGDFQRPRVVVTPEGDVETIFVSQETGKGEQARWWNRRVVARRFRDACLGRQG